MRRQTFTVFTASRNMLSEGKRNNDGDEKMPDEMSRALEQSMSRSSSLSMSF